ncbi:hypothetical protein CYY_002419 [Polysphondylium violaceum]|uniref:Pyrimidine 5'-nucleotidase n=1 Tax=Polysphondylium violaceum TaxID=133409 RepID=A0A8J4V9N7_9MYCE|nr:hypothetical protein CYY_002419 [Polysphondylium violaceum]
MTQEVTTKQAIDHNKIHTLLFDLDNTLYPKSCGLSAQVSKRITQYMSNILQLPEEEVDKVRNHYYKTYGLTLKGLMQHHDVDINNYLDYVHGGLDLKPHIGKDEKLHTLLDSIRKDIKKIIFTNSDLAHSNRICKVLGIDDQFDATLDYLEMRDFTKPHPVSYKMAMEKAGTTDAAGCVFFDDVVENLVEAKKAGIITVLVGATTPCDDPHVDYTINEIYEFQSIFPEIFSSTKQ